jgi:hypothetical protein
MIRMILRFRTKNLTICHGKNLRQNRVVTVGVGGNESSLGPDSVVFDCMGAQNMVTEFYGLFYL